MQSKFNYRKFYEQQTNKQIPKNFEVHHLDLNSNNHNIENLVALPKDIHKQYHNVLQDKPLIVEIDLSICAYINKNQRIPLKTSCDDMFLVEQINTIIKLYPIVEQIKGWVDYRDFLRKLFSDDIMQRYPLNN